MKPNTYNFNQLLTYNSVMKMIFRLLSVVLLCILAETSFAQGVLTHTTDADFNKGNLNNVNVTGNNVVLPYQANGFNINWTATTGLPNKRSNHKLSFWNNKVYLTGGMEMKGMSGGHEVVAYSPSVYVSDVSTGLGTWSAVDSLPYGVSDHAALFMNGFLYVMGGKSDGLPTDSIFYTKFLANGAMEGWKPCSAVLPQPLWGFSAEFVNGYLVIAGGSTQTNEFTATNAVYTALVEPDGDIHSFVSQPSLPEARNQQTMVKYGNQLYLMGGYDDLASVKNTVYYTSVGLDGACSTWQSAGALTQAVYGQSSTCYNGIITVLGGYTDTTGNAISQCYYAKVDNAPAFSWQSDNYYPQHLAFADAFAVNGKVFCLGGFDVFENTRLECYYDDLIMSGSARVKNGSYISPLIDLVYNTQINQLSYTGTTLTNYSVYYRSAESDSTWSSWVNANQTNPIPVSVNKRYFQYMFSFENAPTSSTIALNDVSVNFSASTVSGTLSGTYNWTLAGSPYIVTTNLILQSGSLTIDQGVIVMFMNGTGFEIRGASLVCNGTALKPVIFTSFSGEQGSWAGLYFNSASNAYPSSMNYAIIEKTGYGSRYANLYCESTSKPSLDHCTLRYSSGYGLYLNNSSIIVSNSSLEKNQNHGLCIQNNSYPIMTNSIILNNLYYGIAVLGGTISTSGTWANVGYDYIIWDNLTIGNNSRLTIAPGISIKIKQGKIINIGTTSYSHGELYAIGQPDNKIIFTSYNNANGGWEGLCFGSYSGNPSVSKLKHCIVEKGNQYNLKSYTDQPFIDSCIFRNSAGYGVQTFGPVYNTLIEHNTGDGLRINGSSSVYNLVIEDNGGDGIEVTGGPLDIDHVLIQNNTGNGIYVSSSSGLTFGIINSIVRNNTGHGFCMLPANSPQFYNVSFTGNLTNNEIVVFGGNFTSSALWRNESMVYVIWDNISIEKDWSNPRLTIAPGNSIKIKSGKNISVGAASYYPGELYAIGTPDSLITFSSYNNTIGGWEGIYFRTTSGSSSSSKMKYCVLEKGNQYNLYSESNQPIIDSCIFRYSAGYGVKFHGTSAMYNSTITNNGGDGLNIGGSVVVYNTVSEYNGGDGIDVWYGSPKFDNVIVQYNIGNGIYVSYSNGCTPGIINSTIQNNLGHGFCMSPANSPEFYNVFFSGNLTNNEIIVLGGQLSKSVQWKFSEMPYVIWDNVSIYNNNNPRLTIASGNTIKVKSSKNISVGYSNMYPGEFYAIGSPDSLITFSSYNKAIGGWEGLYFNGISGSPNSSKLKHCIIEKGNTYNLYSSSDQPQIDSCVFWNAANNGIQTNSSFLQVSNSQIIFNNSNGIYISGSSNPIIGNTMGAGCDLFGNGLYDVYNNTTNNISAGYNFWNSTDSAFISKRIYDKYDNSAKGYVLPYNPADTGLRLFDMNILHGQVTYDNTATSVMKNTNVAIKNIAGEAIASPGTNLSGYYFHAPIEDGTYTTFPTSTTPWGGVNATDALKIMRHYAMLETLTGVRKAAADVNASGAINSADAMQVLQRYTQTITSFASGDWYFEKDTITIAGASVENNINGICFGDVNGSYVPYSAKGNSVGLVYEGSVFAGSYEQIEVPVRVKMPLHAGAISLGFNFPEEFMLIESVTLGNGSTNIVHSSENGLFRLAWSEIEPFILNKDEIILILNISTKDLSGMSVPIKLLLYEESEIADENAEVVQDIVLSIPVIEYLLTGLPESELSSVSIYPNPVRGNAIVSLNLSCSGLLNIGVFDVLGNQVKTVSQNIENSENNTILVNLSELKTGVYFIKLKISCNGQEYIFNKKIIVQN